MECVLITKMPELNAMLTYNSAKSGHLHTTNAKKIRNTFISSIRYAEKE